MTQLPFMGRRVLIVDDNFTDRLILKEMLKGLGFTDIQEAEDGAIAESKIDNALQTKNPFHLVFLDIRMPRQGGLSLLDRLRASSKTHDLYVIMMTATASLENIEGSLKLGVNDFIVKPFSPEVVASKVKAIQFK